MDLGELREHDPATVAARAQLETMDLTAAQVVSLKALIEQVAGLHTLMKDGLKRAHQAINASEQRTKKRIERSDARNRATRAELVGAVARVEAGLIQVNLGMHQQEADRRRLELELIEARRVADEAKREAADAADEAEEITGQWEIERERRASQNDDAELFRDATRELIGVKVEERRAAIRVNQHSATTDIEVRAEGRRTTYRTLAGVFGAGGLFSIAALLLLQFALTHC